MMQENRIKKVAAALRVAHCDITSMVSHAACGISGKTSYDILKISYDAGGKRIAGYITQPHVRDKKLPVIVFNRGGFKNFGALYNDVVHVMIGYLASRGYIVVASQYAGGPGSQGRDTFGGDDDVESVSALYDIIVAHPYADRERIGMLGISRGGMVTYRCLATMPWIRAAVVIGGITDMEAFLQRRPKMRSVLGENIALNNADLYVRSALRWSDRLPHDTPLLIMHGARDERVAPTDALRLTEQLIARDAFCKLIVYPRAGHLLKECRARWQEEVVAWFATHVAGND